MNLTTDIKEIWENIKKDIIKSGNINSLDYDIYLNSESTQAKSLDDGILYLTVKNKKRYDYISDNFYELINNIASKKYIFINKVKLIVKNSKEDEENTNKINSNEENYIRNNNLNINQTMTFGSLVVCNFNREIVAAAKAMASSNSANFNVNVMFICGKTGLGKTHILHAMANYLISNNSKAKIACITTEEYINEYVVALNSQNMNINYFNEKYRNLDYLFIDDIQFFKDKKNSQENFFHNFNSLFNNNKKIVVCSDKKLEDLNFNERLISRLQSGISFTISEPNAEERLLILQKKVKDKGFNVSQSVLTYIANTYDNKNIRELEGILNTVYYYCELNGIECDNINIAIEALNKSVGIKKMSQQELDVKSITDAVCSYFDVSLQNIQSSSREAKYIIPRNLAIYIAKKYSTDSNTSIANYFNRDNTTILHAYKTVNKKIEKKDKDTLKHIKNLKDMLII